MHVCARAHSPMYVYTLSIYVTPPGRCLNRPSGLKIILMSAGLSFLSLLNHTIRDSFGAALRPAGVGFLPRKHQAERERRTLYMYAAQLSGCAPKGPTGASFIHSDRNKTGLQICLLPVQWHGETFWFSVPPSKKKKTFRGYTIQKKSNISYCKSLIRNVSSFPALLAFRVPEKAELSGDHSAGETICELKMLLFQK